MKILVKEKNRIVDTHWYATRQDCVKYIQYLLKVDKHTGIKRTYRILDGERVVPDKCDRYLNLRTGTSLLNGYASNHQTRITKKVLKQRKRDSVRLQKQMKLDRVVTEAQFKAG